MMMAKKMMTKMTKLKRWEGDDNGDFNGDVIDH